MVGDAFFKNLMFPLKQSCHASEWAEEMKSDHDNVSVKGYWTLTTLMTEESRHSCILEISNF